MATTTERVRTRAGRVTHLHNGATVRQTTNDDDGTTLCGRYSVRLRRLGTTAQVTCSRCVALAGGTRGES